MRKLLLFIPLLILTIAAQSGGDKSNTIPAGGGGSIAYVASSYQENSTASSTSTTISVTCNGGEFVSIIGFNGNKNNTGLSASATNSNTVASVPNLTIPSNNLGLFQNFYIASCTAGSTTITLNVTGGNTATTLLSVARYTGLTNKTYHFHGTIGTGTNTPVSCSSSTGTGELLVVLAYDDYGFQSYSSLASGYNQRGYVGGGTGFFTGDNLSSTASTQTFSATISHTANWVCGQVDYY